MNARALIRWSALEESRRRRSVRGLAGVSELFSSLLLGAVLAGELSRRLATASAAELPSAVVSASQVWIAAAVCAYSIAIFGAPFRLYWRRDSKILASLPVPGSSLFALALWRSHRSATHISLALSVAILPIGFFVDWQLVSRHFVALLLGSVGVAWLGPAAALSAGAIVASDKAQAMIASMGGEFQAPRTSWLGILPGVSATAVAVSIIASSSWILGGRPPGGSLALILALAIGGAVLAVAWAWTRASEVIPAAVREVAALDQEILAHVELSTASRLESSCMKLLSAKGRLVAAKDAALLRRRYPSPYFVIPCGVVAIWIVAASQPTSYLPWAGSFLGAVLVYSLIMARRAQAEPTELPPFLATLALGSGSVDNAKNLLSTLRIVTIAVSAGPVLVVRSPDVLGASVLVVLAAGLSLIASRSRSHAGKAPLKSERG